MVAAAVVGAAVVGSVASGVSQSNAADKAADAQRDASDRSAQEQREARETARGDLQPFRDAGASALPSLQALVNDPQAQLDYVQDNPFFNALATRSKNDLLNNAAARGKVGSGGTAEALQNSLLLLGSDLVNRGVSQKQNLATIGQNAAAQQGTVTLNTANNISDAYTQSGNAAAAGAIGKANAITDTSNNLTSSALGYYGLKNGSINTLNL